MQLSSGNCWLLRTGNSRPASSALVRHLGAVEAIQGFYWRIEPCSLGVIGDRLHSLVAPDFLAVEGWEGKSGSVVNE
jgi:hypothetical protein